jgi:hypothetical protein
MQTISQAACAFGKALCKPVSNWLMNLHNGLKSLIFQKFNRFDVSIELT